MASSTTATTPACIQALGLAAALLFLTPAAVGAAVSEPAYTQNAEGFVSATGERAFVAGYPAALEFWAPPLQLIRDYRLRFRVPGRVDAVEGSDILRRVERLRDETVRTYVGADFVVREHLFVPLSAAGAIVRYETAGRPGVEIEVGFTPSLDLMWPAALGGQSIGWDARLSAYVQREPLHGFTATIGSAEAVAHDDTANRTRPSPAMSLRIKPQAGDGEATALLIVAADGAGDPPGTLAAKLRSSESELRREAAAHRDAVLTNSLRIRTPDAAVDRALASATLALDRAWMCNTPLGCGAVAGFGPSRPGRRPQYAWFFVGDGLVAMQAMVDVGQFDRARQQLGFIARYQNQQTGMIWHEMSQSAALIDWQGKYPYMFVHVDISFQYLAAIWSYVAATGDTGFARANWRGIAAAYRYCRSVIDPGSGLPHIPPGKQGQNEQDAMRDDIRLSSAWIDAADGFARLARATGHAAAAADAERGAARARETIARDGWDAPRGFWLSGHTLTGAPIHSERPDAVGVLDQRVFPLARVAAVLDRIASPEFLTDWGVRNLSANAPEYDPNLYGSGSVWGLGSAAAATTFWKQHRPLTAWSIWNGLIGWDTLDSAGRLHEVLAGDLYHPELESVPEQTWSSAGLLSATVHGLLGIEVGAVERRLGLAPHLPAAWPEVGIEQLRVGATRLALRIRRNAQGIAVEVDNPGPPVAVDFAPAIALGAVVDGGTVDGAAAAVAAEVHLQDQHARLRFVAHAGTTRATIAYTGGVEFASVDVAPAIGDTSRNPRLAGVRLDGRKLTLDAWIARGAGAADLFTPWQVERVDGATVEPRPGGYRVTFTGEARRPGYARASAVIRFRPAP